MLFAEVRRKLSLDANDNERREDILTSTVFGSLIVGGTWSLLAAWLSAARAHDGSRLELPPVSVVKYWFWPDMAEAEPDVLLLFGDVLVIVEAKYLSGKSGDNSSDPETSEGLDQLAREWRSCDTKYCDSYPPELRDAILCGGAKRALVYLVRQPASAKTRRELEVSRASIGAGAALYCLGWSDLAALLPRQAATSSGWLTALAELLERRGFTSFGGFPSVNVGDVAVLQRAGRWRLAGSQVPKRVVSFPRALAGADTDRIRWLSVASARTEQRIRWSTMIAVEKLALVRRLAAGRR